jgi:hypothetical protein
MSHERISQDRNSPSEKLGKLYSRQALDLKIEPSVQPKYFQQVLCCLGKSQSRPKPRGGSTLSSFDREFKSAIREISALIRESPSSLFFADRSDPPERSRCCKSLVELVGANDRRSELCDGGIGRIARRQLRRAPPLPGDRGFETLGDELMTMQGVYENGSGTLAAGALRRAPLVDALRAICEFDLSKLDSVEPPRGFGRD